ncbi:ladderlectin-like [Genypterus blacodes]|uniref:ladderlectin-like n=1 Tax=Genypterus blacodes TaxID=154954 RepID=UPI003F771FB7
MLWFLCLIALALGDVPPTELNLEDDSLPVAAAYMPCPPFWNSFGGRCYKFIATKKNWADAELFCVSEKANLVSVHSPEEFAFVQRLIANTDPGQDPSWIGLTDIYKQGAWMWSDGSSVDYTDWNTGEPNHQGDERCTHTMWGAEKKWNDKLCSETYSFVCKNRMLTGLFPCQ